MYDIKVTLQLHDKDDEFTETRVKRAVEAALKDTNDSCCHKLALSVHVVRTRTPEGDPYR